MKINGNAVRVGNVLDHEGALWVVTKTQHTQPGKGGAYMQVEMKALQEGTKTNVRFRSSEQVERAYLEEIPYQYLYTEDNKIALMNPTTYEQILLDSDLIGDSVVFLMDGMMVDVCFHNDRPVSVQLPSTVVLEVQEADPVVKGQTASASYKPAVLSNGERTMVPPHIEAGARVVINTADGTYVERAKD